MRLRKKRILWASLAGAALLLLIASAVVPGWVARRSVVRVGAEGLGLSLEVGGAEVSLLGRYVLLEDLAIPNPAGFAPGPLFRAPRVRVVLEWGSLFTDEIRIEEIAIEEPLTIMEQRGARTNLGALMEHLARWPRDPAQPRFRVERVRIVRPAARFRPANGPPGPPAFFPDVCMDDFADRSGGALLLPDLAVRIMECATEEAVAAHGDLVPAGVRDAVGKGFKTLGGAFDLLKGKQDTAAQPRPEEGSP
jgi:hypothetical protein